MTTDEYLHQCIGYLVASLGGSAYVSPLLTSSLDYPVLSAYGSHSPAGRASNLYPLNIHYGLRMVGDNA